MLLVGTVRFEDRFCASEKGRVGEMGRFSTAVSWPKWAVINTDLTLQDCELQQHSNIIVAICSAATNRYSCSSSLFWMSLIANTSAIQHYDIWNDVWHNYNISENPAVQLTSLWLAHTHPNNDLIIRTEFGAKSTQVFNVLKVHWWCYISSPHDPSSGLQSTWSPEATNQDTIKI